MRLSVDQMKKVLAGGRFNILHPGHVFFLKKAKSLGDYLVVIIASDETIKKQKKPLLFPANKRKEVLEMLKFVDKVIVGYDISGESGYTKIIKKVKPDVIALGYDQRTNVQGMRKIISSLGLKCEIVKIDELKGYKTKRILNSNY